MWEEAHTLSTAQKITSNVSYWISTEQGLCLTLSYPHKKRLNAPVSLIFGMRKWPKTAVDLKKL